MESNRYNGHFASSVQIQIPSYIRKHLVYRGNSLLIVQCYREYVMYRFPKRNTEFNIHVQYNLIFNEHQSNEMLYNEVFYGAQLLDAYL
jgi:hypothetical protein